MRFKTTAGSTTNERIGKIRRTMQGPAFAGRTGNALARAKRYMETLDQKDLGQGLSGTLARMHVPSELLPMDDMKDEYESPYYRKAKGPNKAERAKRDALIAELKGLTKDPNYAGVGKRLESEMDTHRWHQARGGATPARLSHKIRAGHGHF